MSFTPYHAGLIVGRGHTDLARAAYDAIDLNDSDGSRELQRGIRDGLHECANREEAVRSIGKTFRELGKTLASIRAHFEADAAEAARWRTRYELTVSYEVGPQDRLRADTEQEARNELADVITRAAARGQIVAAWNIASVRELRADDAEPAGIAHRNTSA